MNKYYIPYNEKATINYNYLLLLYSTAEFNKNNRMYDRITFNSLKDLVNRMNTNGYITISVPTLDRFLKNIENSLYFCYNKDNKTIVLNNDIKKMNKFVILNQKQKDFLLQQNDKFLSKYMLYLIYYCGYSRTKTTDSTAEQILAELGYSLSGKNKEKLSLYNRLLKENNLIKIDNYIDTCGHWRNIYSIL